MSALGVRANGLIEKHGEFFAVDTSERKGVFAPVGPSEARLYCEDGLIATLGRPLYLLLVHSTDPIAILETVEWSGPDLIVRQVVDLRASGIAICRLAVLA